MRLCEKLNEKGSGHGEKTRRQTRVIVDALARTRGGRKRRRSPQLYRPAREVHGEMSF